MYKSVLKIKMTPLIFLLIAILLGCGSENSNDKIGDSYLVDDSLRLIVYNGRNLNPEIGIKIGNETLEFNTSDPLLKLGKSYPVEFKKANYALYLTELPLASIETNNEIVDEPKVHAEMHLFENGKKPISWGVGIELRGRLSKTFPKKSYSVELWEDTAGDETLKDSILDMRKDDDWILDGLWNEPIRARDYVAHDLWLKIGRYPYKEKEKITFGIKRRFCELFVNGAYMGVYYLGEKIDRKQLALKKPEEGIQGELYKGDVHSGGTLFLETGKTPDNNSKFWNGYELEFPDEEGTLDWTNLHNLVRFVVDSDKATFDQEIWKRLDRANTIDYFIFVNVLMAQDNVGRNTFTARYDKNSPYFFVPWDMDGTLGRIMNGHRIGSGNIPVTNGLFDRLKKNKDFVAGLKERWKTLRNGILNDGVLEGKYQEVFDLLQKNGVYEREGLKPDLSKNYNDGEVSFIKSWVTARLIFLDEYFEQME